MSGKDIIVFVHSSEELGDETMALLTLLMGVMLGVTSAEAVIWNPHHYL